MSIRVKRLEICIIIIIIIIIPYILQGVTMNVSKTGNTKSFSKTQFIVHRTE